jgi:hypothetical protein
VAATAVAQGADRLTYDQEDDMSFTYSTGSKTRSRQLRRDVRVALGSSSEQLPDILQVLAAARALGALLDNASGGRFGIAIHDFNPPSTDVGQGEQAIPVGTAIEYVTEARRARAERVERERAERDGFNPWWGDKVVAAADRERAARAEDKREAEAFQAGRLDGGR